jgi:hypothetical protein
MGLREQQSYSFYDFYILILYIQYIWGNNMSQQPEENNKEKSLQVLFREIRMGLGDIVAQ